MPEPTAYRSRLNGKVAVVTGAGAEGDEIGIGRAIAYVLAREGAAVVCGDLDPARAEATAAQITAEGGRAVAVGGKCVVLDVFSPVREDYAELTNRYIPPVSGSPDRGK